MVHNETRARLTQLNKVDLRLYHEISDCLNDGNYDGIPKWDGSRFLIDSFNFTEAKLERQRAKTEKLRKKQAQEIHPQN